MKQEKDCYTCSYMGTIPGDCHSRCKFDWEKSELNMPKGNPHGIKNGWWMFPFNYDPIWMIGECPAYAKEADPKMIKKENALEDLFSILGKRF